MLEDTNLIVVDLETYDPELEDKGSGVYRRDCAILGAAVGSDNSGFRKYYDLGHKGCTAETRRRNKELLRPILENNVPKLGHNFIYDLDLMINWEDLKVNGPLEDTQIRESLIDAYAKHYDLDTLDKKYGGTGKRLSYVEKKCLEMGLKPPFQKYLYLFTAEETEEYALGDIDCTLNVYRNQQPLLEAENLLDLYDMECRLIRPLLSMRKIGVRLDENKRQQVSNTLSQKYREGMDIFSSKYGKININSGADLTRVFKHLDIPLQFTEATEKKLKESPGLDVVGSFAKEVLMSIDHPIAHDILELRGLKTVLNNYVDGAFVEHNVNGRIHCTFYPVVRDDGGTVTGRFSCKNPNLQQVPSKDEKNGPLIREIFIPEEDCWFLKSDYSQIEYRLLVHYAVGPGALKVKKQFLDNPETDYHQFVVELTGLGRKYAKNLNFGTVYCMGVKTMHEKFGWTMEHAKEVSDKYFDMMPFVVPTRNFIIETAKHRGYVRTILNRRARLTDAMRSRAGQRGQEYKLVNYLIQGSAADIMKASMVSAYEAGIFDVIPCHLTVHDELSNSVAKTRIALEAAAELKHLMEETTRVSIPIISNQDIGPSWGEGKKIGTKNDEETITMDTLLKEVV